MTTLSTKRILDVPPQLVLEVAYGVEDPEQSGLPASIAAPILTLSKNHGRSAV